MLAVSDIEKMSLAERLQTMELLWKSFSKSPEQVESPQWHETVLAERSAKVEEGKGRFLTISQLKDRLHKKHK